VCKKIEEVLDATGGKAAVIDAAFALGKMGHFSKAPS
jgi:hypothetical protein